MSATSNALPAEAPRENYLNSKLGIMSWLLTVDHKRIGLLYIATLSVFFFLGGVFAGIIRLELLTPEGDLLSSESYNRAFTGHGVLMTFFVLVPLIPATLGNFLLLCGIVYLAVVTISGWSGFVRGSALVATAGVQAQPSGV